MPRMAMFMETRRYGSEVDLLPTNWNLTDTATVFFDKVLALHKETAKDTAGIVGVALERFEHFNDELFGHGDCEGYLP